MLKNGLIIFVRKPELGKVKTRLALDIGDESALEVYKNLLNHTADVAKQVPVEKFLWSDQKALISDFPRFPFTLFQQKGKDLGERMKYAFQFHFLNAYQKLVIIGSDCPYISVEILETAYKALNAFDLVMGPSIDGGYYLLGMKRLYAPLFSGIPWSTHQVAYATLEKALSLGLSCFQMQPLPDIDTADDLKYWPENWQKLWVNP